MNDLSSVKIVLVKDLPRELLQFLQLPFTHVTGSVNVTLWAPASPNSMIV